MDGYGALLVRMPERCMQIHGQVPSDRSGASPHHQVGETLFVSLKRQVPVLTSDVVRLSLKNPGQLLLGGRSTLCVSALLECLTEDSALLYDSAEEVRVGKRRN